MNEIIQGDCLEVLKKLPENSVDSIVTDPPYELGFMGKSWDNTGIANNKEMWKECLRVLKPGGHLLSFGGTRTYHRMAVAIEDAGFEVRDMIEWVYSTGFPKSLNIGKAVDKLQGNEREIIGKNPNFRENNEENNFTKEGTFATTEGMKVSTKGTSEWEGWGTALKPAHEPICMARKPLSEKTVAENCLKWGTGGINIDESRVDYQSEADKASAIPQGKITTKVGEFAGRTQGGGTNKEINRDEWKDKMQGRFPANLIHDNSEEVRECFPESKSSNEVRKNNGKLDDKTFGKYNAIDSYGFNDSGNASRFFKSIKGADQMWETGQLNGVSSETSLLSIIYQAKASKSERNRGCEGLEEKKMDESRKEGNPGGDNPRNRGVHVRVNNHPTVKPIALMEYLIKMVCPEGGVVLDPFLGSGTTAVAAKKLGRKYLGIELNPEYIEIAKKRINSIPEPML